MRSHLIDYSSDANQNQQTPGCLNPEMKRELVQAANFPMLEYAIAEQVEVDM